MTFDFDAMAFGTVLDQTIGFAVAFVGIGMGIAVLALLGGVVVTSLYRFFSMAD